jgi:TPR repeat protein
LEGQAAMRARIRTFFPAATALLVALVPWTPAASIQPGRTDETEAKVRAAYDRLIECGEKAIAAKAATRPGTLEESKSILALNCMAEFNSLMVQTEIWNGSKAPTEGANFQLELAAKTLLSGSRVGFVATPGTGKDSSAAPVVAAAAPATVVRPAAVPASCSGSVSKGIKAYNAGNYELALCHWLPKAQAGVANAQNNMGVLYERGLTGRTPQSDEEAAEWYYRAAQQGEPAAMRNLAAVQERTGNGEAAQSWLRMAEATEAQQKALRESRQAAAVAILAGGLACALGACPAAPVGGSAASGYSPQGRGLGYGATGSTGRNVYTPPGFGFGSSGLNPPKTGEASPGVRMCPDGSYVSGPCRMAPDGTYVGGTPRMAPDGSYVGGTPRMAPDGSYVGGTGRTIMCPDGSYVVGTRCRLTPDGKYVGQ